MRQVASASRLSGASRTVSLPAPVSSRRQRLTAFMRAAFVGGVLSLVLVGYAAVNALYI